MFSKRKAQGSLRDGWRMAPLKLTMSLLVALLILALPPAAVQAEPGDMLLVSSDASGAEGNAQSLYADISADGRYVAFASLASDLVTPNTTGQQVFRKDLLTGEVELVSSDAAGAEGDGASLYPSISADGRYVAFASDAHNLITIPTSIRQIYWKDMLTGGIYLVSMTATAAEGDGISDFPAISEDGKCVAFHSNATNLVTPATTGRQVFRRDLHALGLVELVSADAAGTQGDGNAHYSPAISPDGRYVSFTSDSTNLVTPATSGQELFSKDMETAEVKLVSSDAAWAESNQSNGYPSYSCDARYVSFASNANNLIPAVGGQQVYRKDLLSGEIVLVSADAAGTPGVGMSQVSAISADGRYVAFESFSTNLVAPATSGWEIFRKDMLSEEVMLVSSDAAGAEGNGTSRQPSMTPDGKYVAFDTLATNLVAPPITSRQVLRKELAVPYVFYFAEGYTGEGFQEYLCLGNPGATGAFATITYMFPDGTFQEQEVELAADSRVTVNVNAVVGEGKDVSAKIGCDVPFVAERPMYFSYGPSGWTGGHDEMGARAPACSWYFAEGYTGAGFDEWICVLNPGDLPAELTFYFQTQEVGQLTVPGLSVGPNTRASFKVNDLLGGDTYQTSLRLEADHPVVAERPMYFDYSGMGGWSWTGGHCVMGIPRLANEYYFAEGTTRSGFEEWLCIQNPGYTPLVVHATYNLRDGAPVERDYGLDPGYRMTVYVPEDISAGEDVSVHLSSSQYFLAERPMYFDYSGLGGWSWTGGHCVIGAGGSSTEWFFAEGYTGAGFEEWLCIQNPGAADAAVTVTYYPEDGASFERHHTVGAASRYTVPVNADAGPDKAVSARVSSSVPVIVERPMYFSYGPGWTGGHDVVGYTP